MRVLLDECLARKLKKDLPGQEVRTVPEMVVQSILDALSRGQPGEVLYVRE
jgi:hypothetical protein